MPSPASLFLTGAGLLASLALATPPFKLCTGGDCGYCPNTVTSAGTGYPACVVYDRDTVLGGYADSYENTGPGKKNIYYDLYEQTNPTCRTIIRTPANVDDENCGAPVYIGKGGVCVPIATDTTFMVQFCCGDGDCSSAGAKRSVSGLTGQVLQDSQGNHIVPKAVGHRGQDLMETFLYDMGINSTSVKSTVGDAPEAIKIGYPEQLSKRACGTYHPDGAPYTKTADYSYALGGQICGDGSTQSVMNTQSVSRSTTFGTSVSDPFGIVSVSVDFTFEKSASQSYTYMFTAPKDTCGHVTFTPILKCTSGTIDGCGNGDSGETCTADRISDSQLNGAYRFTITD